MNRSTSIWVTSAMLGLGYAAAGIGQDSAGGGAGVDSGGLEEIIVTAERRQADIQKTAIPMTAISGDEIAARGQTLVDEVLRDAPSVQIQKSPQGADIVVRGIGGNATGGISQDPSVSTFTDGVYNGLAAATLNSLYDVQRVEVLRGPQGTLYGRNSSGGAINVLTNNPGAAFGAGVNVGAGNLSLRRIDGFINLPVADTLALRIAFNREQRDGFYSNGGGEVDNLGARVKAKWTPSERFSLLARADYSHQRGYSQTTVPVNGISGSCGLPPFLPGCALFASANPGDRWDTSVAPFSPFTVYPVYDDSKYYNYSLQVNADLGFGELTVIPAYSRANQEESSAGLFAPSAPPFTTSSTTTKQTTVEARLASPAASRLKWVVGAYYLDTDANQSGTPGGQVATFYAQQSDNKRPATSYAGFAQATIPFAEQFRGTIGGRYTVDKKTVFYGVCSSTDGIHCGPSPTGAGTYISPAENLSNRYSSFTYKAGFEYDIAPNTMAYAQVSTGYKAGGWSTASNPPVSYNPEKLINYELGVKSRWLDQRLELNADVYYYQYKDQQLELHPLLPYTVILPAQYIPAEWLPGGAMAQQNPNTQIIDVNAGNSRYTGIEAQARYRFTSHDEFSLDAAYNHAVYGHFVVDTTGGPPGTGYTSQYFDVTGLQEAHAPLWSGRVGYQHFWDIGSGRLTLQGAMRLQSSTYTTIQRWFADGHTKQPGYHQSDANLVYVGAQDRWIVTAWVKNIENNAVVTNVYPLYKQTLDISRTFGASASFKF